MGKRGKNASAPTVVTSPEVKPAPAAPAPVASEKVHKAFTLERVKDGWSMLTVTFQGDKLLSVERTEPDMKSFAIEHFKIAAFKYWGSIG